MISIFNFFFAQDRALTPALDTVTVRRATTRRALRPTVGFQPAPDSLPERIMPSIMIIPPSDY